MQAGGLAGEAEALFKGPASVIDGRGQATNDLKLKRRSAFTAPQVNNHNNQFRQAVVVA